MHLQPPTTLEELAPYLSKFFSLVGRDRWFKRAGRGSLKPVIFCHIFIIIVLQPWLALAR